MATKKQSSTEVTEVTEVKEERSYTHACRAKVYQVCIYKLQNPTEPWTDAYASVYTTCTRQTAANNVARMRRSPVFKEVWEQLNEAKSRMAEDIRTEIVAGHLEDMRNQELSAADRRLARIALAEMFGLKGAQQIKVEVGTAQQAMDRLFNSAAEQPLIEAGRVVDEADDTVQV